MRLCDYCSAGMAILRAWEETAEYYCAADTPISADGVRGYIAELNAKLAAANQRIAELEAALTAANQSRPASVTEQDLANNMPDEFGD